VFEIVTGCMMIIWCTWIWPECDTMSGAYIVYLWTVIQRILSYC